MKHIILIAILIIASACNTTKNKTSENFISGELLVGFTNKDKAYETIKILEINTGVHFKRMLMDSKTAQIAHFEVPKGKEKEYIKIFTKVPNVKYAEVNGIATVQPVVSTSIKNEITDEMMSDYATLTVTKIENGKDGYTATLKNDAGGLYVCTISIPNLGDNYIDLEVGDMVKIAGEYAESYPVQIFVKRIVKVDK